MFCCWRSGQPRQVPGTLGTDGEIRELGDVGELRQCHCFHFLWAVASQVKRAPCITVRHLNSIAFTKEGGTSCYDRHGEPALSRLIHAKGVVAKIRIYQKLEVNIHLNWISKSH